MPNPMSHQQVLDRYFLEMRCKVLDVAAALDRLNRASGAESPAADRRLTQLDEAIGVLSRTDPGRAETIQQIFSLSYDPEWPRPTVGERSGE